MSNVEALAEAYVDAGAEIERVMSTADRMEFRDDGFPHLHSLGKIAVEHGFVVSSVRPDNAQSPDGCIAVFVKPFRAWQEERTVEVEKTVTVVRVDGEEKVIHD